MSQVLYDGKPIIPAPLVSIQKAYDLQGDGTKVGTRFQLNFQGTIVAYKGSPDSNGTFWASGGYPPDESIQQDYRLRSILNKQQALRGLFDREGAILEIVTPAQQDPMTCNPRNISLNFNDGIWTDRCDYTISMECERLYGLISDDAEEKSEYNYHIQDKNESWQFELGDSPNTFRVTHAMSAKGKRFYTTDGVLRGEAWEMAKEYVLVKMSGGWQPDQILNFATRPTVIDSGNVDDYPLDPINADPPGAVAGLVSSHTPYNRTWVQSTDQTAGTFSVTETFLLAPTQSQSIPFIEDFNVAVKIGEQQSTVNVDGTITGLTTGLNQFSDRIANADSAWANTVKNALYSRANTAFLLYRRDENDSLNATALNFSVTRTPNVGTIQYNYEFNDRPSNCLSDAEGNPSLNESIAVTEQNQGDVIAQVIVPGRTKGPILQNINTKTAHERQLAISATFRRQRGCTYGNKPFTDPTVAGFAPTGAKVFKVQDSETWDMKNGQYSRSVNWIYEE